MDDDNEDEPFVEDEAEESSDDEDSSDESEEEGEEDEGLVEDLIDDNPINEEAESEEDSSDEVKTRRKRKKIDDRLEDEDYDLIAENTGIQLQRKKFRRVRLEDSDDEEEIPAVGGVESAGGEGGGTEEDVGMVTQSTHDTDDCAHVFGDSDDEEMPESQGSGDKARRTPEDDDDDDFGFIVDDHGQPLRKKKGDGTYTEPALLEAQDIFGLDFNPAELDRMGREGLGSDEEDELEDEDEEYGSDVESELGETVTPRRSKKARLRKSKTKASIYSVYEPSELERGHFTEKDAEIRVTDAPERFQMRNIPVQKTEEGELDDEAEWIFTELYVKAPISKQPYFMAEKHHSGGTRGSHGNKTQQSTVPKIKEALNFMRNHSFEVPFIANYRREYVEPELDVYDLWKVYHWDEKWMQLKLRKKNMHRLFERMRDYQFEKVREQPDKALTEDTRALTDEDLLRLDTVMSTEELSDVYAHFSLYYGRDLISMQNSRAEKTTDSSQDQDTLDLSLDDSQTEQEKKKVHKVKQAHRRDFYSICQEHGLGSLAAKFGLTPEQFGENLRDNYQRHETEQHHDEPETAAKDYVQPGFFSTERSVLQGACHMVAMQIAAEPLVRQSLRQVFQSRAVLSVRPTKKGRKMIDESHSCCTMKYLRNKPVRDLKGDEFLKLVQAEKDHLLEMKISIDLEHGQDKRSSVQSYFEEIRQLFYRDEFSTLVEKWNAQRAQAVAHALLKVLYPLMEKELRNKLLLEAKDHVMQSCVHKFRKWLDSAPIPVKREEEENSITEQGPYAEVLACAYSPDKTVPAFCCFVDSFGEVVDFLRLNNLLKRRNSPFEKEREDKEADLENFKNFVSQRHPDLIVVTAESREAMGIMDDFRDSLTELEQEEDVPVVPVEMVDPSIARIYSKSRRAKEAFSEYPELLKMAVCLSLHMQEPIHEFSALMNSEEEEILALRMHPLQDSLPKDKLKASLEMELVTRVNDVGVDVNFILEHPHTTDTLTYVCGLGPRKAAALLKILKQENAQLQNRSQLVTQCSIGPQVFINCAGFIRIDTAAFNAMVESIYIEVLDSTRIHPETYEWARKMAVDALEYDETGDENHPSGAVEEILKTPDKLRDLDLDAFAEELERQDYGNKRTTLYDIRDELFGPYKERRSPYASLTQEEKFILLTGETPDSLYKGKLVTCTVVGIVRRKLMREVLDRAQPIQNKRTHLWQCPFCLMDDFNDMGMVWQHFDDGSCPGQSIGVRTRLENGLSGFILTRNLSDKHVNAPEERVHIGMTIHCRILRVNTDKFSVDLTCKSSDLADKEGEFSVPKDSYFDHDASEKDRRKEETTQKKPQQRYIKRVIVHPSFMNCSFAEAEQTLAKMDQGEAVFRPSSKGPDHLTLTWKVDEDIHLHIDIKEQGKPNQFSLGKSLLIGNEEYEDLDEILARFVQPMASYARDLITHKCFRGANGGNVDILKKMLKEEKAKNPKRIPYFFSTSKQYPGKFCLGYQPGSRPRVEYLSVTPEGFRYRNKLHSNVNSLIKWFKEHYQDPIPRPAPTSSNTSGSQIPSHITQKVDPNLYSQLQAAVHTAHHQQRDTSGTPYTPTHLAYSTGTPTPQYGQHPPHAGFGRGYGAQGGQYGNFQQIPPQRGGWGGGPPNWNAMGRTPTQTPGRTPAYTPSQTPHSMISSSSYGTPPVMMGRGRVPPHGMPHRRPGSPIGTPVLDE